MSTTPTRPPSLLRLLAQIDALDRRQQGARERLVILLAFDMPEAVNRDHRLNERLTADAQLLTLDQQSARSDLDSARREWDDLQATIQAMEYERVELDRVLATRLREILRAPG